ncbi:MAG: suppressor of fused domain protein [Kofleriaceae bacterium]
MELELTVVQPPTDLGFIAAFAITDQMIHIAGGTSERVPTLLASSNARHFERQRAPRDLGLRDVVVQGEVVWVCGEYGQLAVSRDRGTTWRLFDTATELCLHALALASDGAMWVVGDGGFAARVVADQLERLELGTAMRFTAVKPIRDEMVLLGYDGMLRRWKAGEVTIAATGTAKPINALQRTKRGTWIVAGDAGFIARSPDGAWWTRVKTEADVDLEAITLYGDRIVIVGDRGQILISGDDGRTWQHQPSDLAVHLWAVAPFGDGMLIGGDDGLIAKLAPPGDRTWEDRVNVFGGAKPLDLQFAAGPIGFVTKYLAALMQRDEPDAAHAEAFVRAYGLAPPPDIAAYYAAAVDARLADLHVDHDALEPGARNLFESLVVGDGNGLGLIEAFCGAFRIGHADNGESFHVELYEWDGPRQVVRYAGGAFTVVADSLDSLVYLAALHGAHRDDRISDDALQIGLRKLVGRTAPMLEPKRRDTEFLFFRSRWITALLQDRLDEVTQLFNADFNQIVPADQLSARYDACERFIPTALYSMWRAFLFGEPELARYLEIGRRHKARLVRDAVALIDELRAGRSELGAIHDVQAHLAAFRALDLDPRRAEARKREADERAAAEARAKAVANAELDAIEPSRWSELGWRWLDNGIAHRQLLARLDATSPTAAQLAELDELRGTSYDKRLGLVRIAEELSAELEAVLVGSLVRDDTLAGALPPVAASSEDDEAPGWAAIDRALAAVYKGADPHAHFGTVLPYSLGGSAPIQGISVYLRDEPVPHFHFVTYGFSDLMRKETDVPDISGFGFELTFRLARATGDEKVPEWAATMLENLGRYVLRTGHRFAAGDRFRPSLTGTITHAPDTALVALVFTDDPELDEIHSQFGKARFVQLVGITDDEYKLTEEWSIGGLVELLRRRLPVLVTDVARRSVLADAATSIVVKKRVALEGSDEASIRADHLQLATGEGLRVELGALAAQGLPRAIRGRIRHGRTYTIHGPEGIKLHLGPATAAPRLTVADREVTFELTPALATAVEDKLRGGLVGDYRFDHGLRVIVTPSFVTESSGLAREVHGIADPEEAERLIAEHNASVAPSATVDPDPRDDAEPATDGDDDAADDDADDADAAADDPPPSPIRVKQALAMTTRALGFAPRDGDVQFTHAMLLLDGETAGLDTLDSLIAVLPSFEPSVRINVAARLGRAEHPRFDEVVDAALSDVLPAKVVGDRSFTVSGTVSGTGAAASYGEVAEDLFAELAQAILVHAPNRMVKLVPVLPANVTLLAKIAHDAIQADERDHALALYDRVLELPIPDEGEARINYLRSLNNACIQAHAVKAYDAAARIADRAQPFAPENPFIYHSAACAYAAVGDLAKAFHQVKLAIEHDYEHLAKVETDRDLGHLLDWPEFQALFRDWHARQEGN